jgi:two-component system nitrogen regulation sensor histidine kinase NtrY
VKHPRFRTRLFLILALFAFVPSILLTIGWSALAARVLPLLSGTGAWEQVAVSGERAIRLAREAPGSPEARAALAEHEEQLGESRMQARRFRLLSERAVPAIILVAVFALGALSLVASRVAGHLSRQLSRPLDQVVGWTTMIARAEALPSPDGEETRGAPEFGVLRQRMRQMAADLEAGRRTALENERLSAFRESARQVAHELKNPLTPIRFAVASLKRTANADQRETIDVLDAESARLEAMAKSFAQFGRLPEGPTAAVGLVELAQETVRSTVPDAVTASVTGDERLAVLGQHDALQRALANVVLNAVDATGAKGRIEVRVERAGDLAVVAVRDDGVGIAPEQLGRIWEPYVTAKTGGTGLGLAIVKQTIVAHGGRVEAESAPGRGTEIRLVLPLAAEGT